jgi:hypothetical protein
MQKKEFINTEDKNRMASGEDNYAFESVNFLCKKCLEKLNY